VKSEGRSTGTEAWLHGLIHRGNPGDLDFYVRVCRGARDVLELGCGQGRILLGLALAGYPVTGLESDDGLLAAAEERRRTLPDPWHGRVRLIRGDMRDFDLGRAYDRVVIPYGGLFYLLDDDEVGRCLACVRRHLAPGGSLVLDGYLPDFHADREPLAPGVIVTPPTHLTTVQDGSRTVEVLEAGRWVTDLQRVDATYVFHVHENGSTRTVRQSVRQRYLFPDQIASLLQGARLEVTGQWGDFRGGHLAAGSRHVIVRARRTADGTA
jgi:SAM-dependent methyltransferase